MKSQEKNSLFSCSFCGHFYVEVGALIAGPNVFICDECIEIARDCSNQIKKDRHNEAQKLRISEVIKIEKLKKQAMLGG